MRQTTIAIGIICCAIALSLGRVCVAQESGASEIDRAVEAIAIQAVDEGHEEVCDSLRELQGQHGDPFIRICLAELLGDDQRQVRTSAAYACGQLELDLTPIRLDLIGELSRSFGSTVWQVADWGPGRLPEFLASEVVSSRDEKMRWASFDALSFLAPENESAVAILIRGLSSDDDDVRWCSAALVGDYGELSEPAIPRLIELTTTIPRVDESLRRASVRSLGRIALQGDVVVPLLVSLLDEPDVKLRGAAARALAEFGEQAVSATPRLVQLLDDSDLELRRDAAFALGRFGAAAEPAIPRLVELLNDPPYEGPFCGTCGIPPSHWAGSALVCIGTASIPALIEALDDGQIAGRSHAANALAYFGPAALDAVPALVEATEFDDVELRTQSILTLGYLNLRPELTVPALSETLGHETAETRRTAAFALGLLGSNAGAAAEALREALEDTNEDVRREAATALSRIEANDRD